MRSSVAVLFGLALSLLAAPAFGKVCYHCKDSKPVPFVCAQSDTFTARKNARAEGCNWSTYSSSCQCGRWVSSKGTALPSFVTYALSLFPAP